MEYSVHDKERCPECGLWKSKLSSCRHCMTRPNRGQALQAMHKASMMAIAPATRPRSASCAAARVPASHRPALEQTSREMDSTLLRMQQQTLARERALYQKLSEEARYNATVGRAHEALACSQFASASGTTTMATAAAEATMGVAAPSTAVRSRMKPSNPAAEPLVVQEDEARFAMNNYHALSHAIGDAMNLAASMQGEGREHDAATITDLIVAAQQLQLQFANRRK